MKDVLNWSIDPAHSKVQFSVKHMVISTVTGEFKKYDFRLNKMEDSLESAELEFDIDPSTIDTGIGDRDNHLKSADFFDVEKYPKINFRSTEITKMGEEDYKMKGDLTIKDVTKPIEFDVTFGGQITDPWGNIRAGYSVTGTLNRFDYNLTWNNLIESGGAVVGKNVKINCEIEIVKPQEVSEEVETE